MPGSSGQTELRLARREVVLPARLYRMYRRAVKVEAVDADGHRVVLIAIVEILMRGANPMADELRMALAEVLRKAGVEQADFLREGVRVLAEELMEMELAEHVGAERHERTAERAGIATAIASGPGIRAWARSSCRCRGCGTGASFRACSSDELGAVGRHLLRIRTATSVLPRCAARGFTTRLRPCISSLSHTCVRLRRYTEVRRTAGARAGSLEPFAE